jgi:SAM-dependent methyltransferase
LTHDVGFDFWARGATPGVLRRLREARIDSGLVVELGCGSGIAAAAFADAGYDVFGVDVSEAMVEIARSRAPRARFVCTSLHDVELPPCVAVVAMGEILSYAGVSDSLLERVRSALAPGGLFLFDVATPGRGDDGPARAWFEGDGWVVCVEAAEDADARRLTREIVAFVERDGQWRRSDEVHSLHLYDPDYLVASVTAAGFEDARVLDEGYGPELEPPGGIAVLAARAPTA